MKCKALKLLLLFLFLLITANLFGAENRIKQKGYLLYVDYTWFFQPCPDSSKDVYESLNTASFRITTGNDGFNGIFYSMEDSLYKFHKDTTLYYRWKLDSVFFQGDIKYTYCEMEYSNRFDTIMGTVNLHPCMYELIVADKKYSLGCFFFQPKILKLRLLDTPNSSSVRK